VGSTQNHAFNSGRIQRGVGIILIQPKSLLQDSGSQFGTITGSGGGGSVLTHAEGSIQTPRYALNTHRRSPAYLIRQKTEGCFWSRVSGLHPNRMGEHGACQSIRMWGRKKINAKGNKVLGKPQGSKKAGKKATACNSIRRRHRGGCRRKHFWDDWKGRKRGVAL